MANSRRASWGPAACLPAGFICAAPNRNGPALPWFSLSASWLGAIGDACFEDAESDEEDDASMLRFLFR